MMRQQQAGQQQQNAVQRQAPAGSRPRICVISTTPLNIHFFLRPHLRALADRAEVTLALNPRNDSYTPSLDDLPVRRIDIDIRRPIAPADDLKTLWQLVQLFRRERFDLIWPVAPKAGLLALLAGRLAGLPRRVFIYQGEVWASRQGPMRALLKSMDKIIAACATDVLAVSAGEKAFLEAEAVVAPGRLAVLGAGSIGGVDCDRFRPDPQRRADIRARHGIPDSAVLILYLGRLHQDKGITELADAFGRLAGQIADGWLLLVGPDEAAGQEALRQRLGAAASARTCFAPFTAEPEAYMAAADLLCLPSYREGFPMTILEAAACGLPAVGSRIYGVADAIEDEITGLLCPPRDAFALADALEPLLRDGALRLLLGQAARARAKLFYDHKTVVQGYVDLLLRLAGEVREGERG